MAGGGHITHARSPQGSESEQQWPRRPRLPTRTPKTHISLPSHLAPKHWESFFALRRRLSTSGEPFYPEGGGLWIRAGRRDSPAKAGGGHPGRAGVAREGEVQQQSGEAEWPGFSKAIGSKSGGASQSSSSDSRPSSAPSWLNTQARFAHLYNGGDHDCKGLAELPWGPSELTDPSVMSARFCAR